MADARRTRSGRAAGELIAALVGLIAFTVIGSVAVSSGGLVPLAVWMFVLAALAAWRAGSAVRSLAKHR